MEVTVDFIKYAFVAGEVSPTLYGRSDLEKYDLGLKNARNVFVDYRGGLSSRPGSVFVDFVMEDDKPTKFVPFKFAPDLADTYTLLFGHQYIRFLQGGAYVLEDDLDVEGLTIASPGVVTSTAHGFSNGDWVKLFEVGGIPQLEGRTFVVAGATTDTFQLNDTFGNPFSTVGMGPYTSGGVVARIYTVETDFDAADLYTLRARQSRNLIRLTHPLYPIYDLVRNSDIDWELSIAAIGNSLSSPTGLTATPSTAGDAGMVWAVTAIGPGGEESLASARLVVVNSVDYATTAGSLKLTWSPVANAQSYNVYRSNLTPDGGDASRSMLVGFVGSSVGTEFIDTNIIPDFTLTPPENYNPFTDGAVTYIDVTAEGTGYSKNATVSVSGGGGSGFSGYPIVNEAGEILGVVIVNGGGGYTSAPTVSFGGGGSGATATAEVGPTTGNFPSVSEIFQQRQVYAATLNQPLTMWGSKPRLFDNFDGSRAVVANDSYEYDLDSEEAAPIRHLTAMRAGLLVWSQAGIWQLTGGTDQAVTATNALADPQSFTGVALLPPLKIDTDLLYLEGKGSTVRLLAYNDLAKVYSGQDMSILSSHLFTPFRQLTHWSYAQEPFKIVWARRTDGALLTFTVVKEQNVYAWTQNWTKGLYEDVLAIQEGNQDRVYTMVSRYINGRWTKMVEVFADREIELIEDAWCVDSGLALPLNTPNANLISISAAQGEDVVVVADAAVFTSGDVGNVLRVGGGKGFVTEFVSSTEIKCHFTQPITSVIPESDGNGPLLSNAGDWFYDTPVTVMTGLWHLEGETVSILADGNVLPTQVVVDGTVTLTVASTRVIIGLPYRSWAETLPAVAPDQVIEGRRKRDVAVAVQVSTTRGMQYGTKLTNLREIKERSTEPYGEPTVPINGVRYNYIPSSFNLGGTLHFVQDNPLPMTLLGIVIDTDVGDDKD